MQYQMRNKYRSQRPQSRTPRVAVPTLVWTQIYTATGTIARDPEVDHKTGSWRSRGGPESLEFKLPSASEAQTPVSAHRYIPTV